MGNEQSGCRHEPPPAGPEGSIAAKPIKSAMTRSQSIRSNHNNGIMGDLEAATTTTGSGSSSHGDSQQRRYIPKMDRAHHGGLIMPTRPMGTTSAADHHSKSAGVESPQWGWYINTTPPTPEMYHSRSSMFKHNHSNSSSDYSFTSTTASTSSDVSQYQAPNRVFQGLKASSNKPHMGWPSVPL